MGNCIHRNRHQHLAIIAATLLLGVSTTASAADTCNEQALSLRGDWGQARFTIALADEPAERSQGLMNVPSMPLMSGMLFAYEQPQSATFWMRNTLIPLDMLFADEFGVIQHIHSNAIPMDETTIPGGDDIQYVLEVNGGLSGRLGIEIGDEMQHPAIGFSASWPCGAD